MNKTDPHLRGLPPDKIGVAIIVPTRDRADDLQMTVTSLLAQTVMPEQLIVVDQSLSDESIQRVVALLAQAPEVVRSAVELQCIHDPTISGASAARNRAIPFVKSEITLFLDDDVVLEPTFVESIQDTYRRYEVQGVSGIITNYARPALAVRLWTAVFVRGPFHDDRQPVYWGARTLKGGAPIRVSRFGAGLMSFWTELIATHRFDENLTGACVGEDIDFCARLGNDAVLVITASARLVHKRSPVARSSEYWLSREVRAAWYLFRRNWNRGMRNRLCLVWLSIGYLVVALFIAARHLSVLPLRAVFKGIQESQSSLAARELS